MISGITMEQPEDMVLYLDEKTMSDNKTMADYNLNHVTARATSPIVIVVCFRDRKKSPLIVEKVASLLKPFFCILFSC